MISPSQITAAACPRKWAFKQLARLPYEPGPAAQFGLAGHDCAEGWLLHGTPPDQLTAPGRLMAEGIPYLPRPGTCLCEVDFQLQTKTPDRKPNPLWFAGVPWHGYLDVLTMHADGQPMVVDHKFTSRPDRALTPETLRTDPQGILYPFVAATQLGAKGCHSRWLYYPRNGKRKPFPVDDYRTLDELTHAMHVHLVPMGRVLYEMKSLAPRNDLAWVQTEMPCCPAACDWAGRWCDFNNHCNMRNK